LSNFKFRVKVNENGSVESDLKPSSDGEEPEECKTVLAVQGEPENIKEFLADLK